MNKSYRIALFGRTGAGKSSLLTSIAHSIPINDDALTLLMDKPTSQLQANHESLSEGGRIEQTKYTKGDRAHGGETSNEEPPERSKSLKVDFEITMGGGLGARHVETEDYAGELHDLNVIETQQLRETLFSYEGLIVMLDTPHPRWGQAELDDQIQQLKSIQKSLQRLFLANEKASRFNGPIAIAFTKWDRTWSTSYQPQSEEGGFKVERERLDELLANQGQSPYVELLGTVINQIRNYSSYGTQIFPVSAYGKTRNDLPIKSNYNSYYIAHPFAWLIQQIDQYQAEELTKKIKTFWGYVGLNSDDQMTYDRFLARHDDHSSRDYTRLLKKKVSAERRPRIIKIALLLITLGVISYFALTMKNEKELERSHQDFILGAASQVDQWDQNLIKLDAVFTQIAQYRAEHQTLSVEQKRQLDHLQMRIKEEWSKSIHLHKHECSFWSRYMGYKWQSWDQVTTSPQPRALYESCDRQNKNKELLDQVKRCLKSDDLDGCREVSKQLDLFCTDEQKDAIQKRTCMEEREAVRAHIQSLYKTKQNGECREQVNQELKKLSQASSFEDLKQVEEAVRLVCESETCSLGATCQRDQEHNRDLVYAQWRKIFNKQSCDLIPEYYAMHLNALDQRRVDDVEARMAQCEQERDESYCKNELKQAGGDQKESSLEKLSEISYKVRKACDQPKCKAYSACIDQRDILNVRWRGLVNQLANGGQCTALASHHQVSAHLLNAEQEELLKMKVNQCQKEQKCAQLESESKSFALKEEFDHAIEYTKSNCSQSQQIVVRVNYDQYRNEQRDEMCQKSEEIITSLDSIQTFPEIKNTIKQLCTNDLKKSSLLQEALMRKVYTSAHQIADDARDCKELDVIPKGEVDSILQGYIDSCHHRKTYRDILNSPDQDQELSRIKQMYENNNIPSNMIESVRLYLGYYHNKFRTKSDSFGIKIVQLSNVSKKFVTCKFGECKVLMKIKASYNIKNKISSFSQKETFKGSKFKYGYIQFQKYISDPAVFNASKFKVELEITSSGRFSSSRIKCKTGYLLISKWPSVLQCNSEKSGDKLELQIKYDRPYSGTPPSLEPLAKAH